MDNDGTSSLLVKILSFLLFLLLAVGSGIWFVSSSTSLISSIMNHESIIEFDKGSMYMLGCSIGLFAISVAAVPYVFMGKKLSEKGELLAARVMVLGVIIMFIFPHVAHYYVDNEIERGNYSTCEKATYQWLRYKKYYYTDTPETCNKLVMGKG